MANKKNKKGKKKERNKDIMLAWSLIFTSLVLLLPFFVQFYSNNNILLGDESYYHVRMAGIVENNNIILDDPLREEGYMFEPFHYVLGYTAKLIGLENAARILPFILGILSSFVIFFIMKKLKIDKQLKKISMFFIIFSPTFIYNFTNAQPFSLISLILLLSFYTLISNKFMKLLSPLFFMIACFLDPRILVAFIIPLGVFIYRRTKYKLFIPIMSIAGILGLFLRSLFGLQSYSLNIPSLSFVDMLKENLIIFNSDIGFPFVIVVLTGIAFISSWKEKNRFFSFYLMLFTIFISVLFIEPEYKVFLSLIISVFSASAFLYLMKMKWELKILKELIRYMIIVSIILSSSMFIGNEIDNCPEKTSVTQAKWLYSNSEFDEKIFSHPSNQNWVEFYTQRKFISVSKDNRKSLMALLMTRNEKEAIRLSIDNDIEYLFVDSKTRNLMFNEKNNIGLEFVMSNSECFVLNKEFADVKIWHYTC